MLVFLSIVLLSFLSNVWSLGEEPPEVVSSDEQEIYIEEAPFSAAFVQGGKAFCAGTIISSFYVLTVIFCVERDGSFTIVVGTVDIDEEGNFYNVENTIKSENGYDVALAKVATAFSFNAKVYPIPLYDGNDPIAGFVRIVGWGTLDGSEAETEDLQEATLPIVANPVCKVIYLTQRDVTDKFICAGGPVQDNCVGDRGGPLIINGAQVGVISFIQNCATHPVVATSIPQVRDWILAKIEDNP